MGAPALIFLQYIEFSYVIDIITKYSILGYFRYVDDILIIYDSMNTDIHLVLKEFNQIQPQLQYTIECDNNGVLNYLDLILRRSNSTLEFSLFRKPTYTDIIIPFNSCHPKERIFSAVRFLISRSQWPSGLRRGSAAARLLGLRFRIPPRAWMFVCFECCVFVR